MGQKLPYHTEGFKIISYDISLSSLCPIFLFPFSIIMSVLGHDQHNTKALISFLLLFFSSKIIQKFSFRMIPLTTYVSVMLFRSQWVVRAELSVPHWIIWWKELFRFLELQLPHLKSGKKMKLYFSARNRINHGCLMHQIFIGCSYNTKHQIISCKTY